MNVNNSQTSVLMLPWLAHGHISSFLELAKRLIQRNFYIYFCSTPVNLNFIKDKITQQNLSLSIQLVELHVPTLPDLPPHYHSTKNLPPHLMSTLKKAFEMSSPNFSTILKTLNPNLVVYDFLQPWASAVASSQNIPAVLFLSIGAGCSSFVIHRIKYPGLEFPYPSMFLDDHENTIITRMLEPSTDGVNHMDLYLESCNQSFGLILFKTFRELEGKYIEYHSGLLGKKVVPVGPLVEDPIDEFNEKTEITDWLNKQDRSSTVFVSFGSEYFLSKEEREEIAHGLELSKVNFVWVVRFPNGEDVKLEEALPDCFLEKVRERGMVVEGWAPQTKILGHSSIGGFVSHCGWSSVMESMKLGVPIIAMPMNLDQPLNARIVSEAGVGVKVKRDERGGLQREEIAKVVREVVVEKNGEDLRRRVRELSENLRKKGDEEIDGVVQELAQVVKSRKC